MKNILVSGSIAYDNIMSFEGSFSDTLDSDKEVISAAFLIKELKKNFGGCAANITFNLNQLGLNPIMMGALGADHHDYSLELDRLKISTKYVQIFDDVYSPQAFITSDSKGNQLTSFYPGAMNLAHKINFPSENIDLAIISPDGYESMQQKVMLCDQKNIPFIFDPGQGIGMFSSDELKEFSKCASILALNEYEWEIFQQKTGYSIDDVKKLDTHLLITLGEKGSIFYAMQETIVTPAIAGVNVIDPTGCGDAYRAGFLYGWSNDLCWSDVCMLGSIMGGIAVEYNGTQNHNIDFLRINQLIESQFNSDFRL